MYIYIYITYYIVYTILYHHHYYSDAVESGSKRALGSAQEVRHGRPGAA